MISAKEAREQANNTMSDKTHEQLQKVELSIKSAIKTGRCECYYYGGLSNQVIKHLESLQYTVKHLFDQRDGDMYMIKW